MAIVEREILLEDFEVMARIGIHDFERAGPQRVLISVEIDLATDGGEHEDEIDDVLDYDFLRAEIGKLVESRHFNLQETLCREIVALCRDRAGIEAVTVTTRKPDVYPDCRSVGYRLRYRRDPA